MKNLKCTSCIHHQEFAAEQNWEMTYNCGINSKYYPLAWQCYRYQKKDRGHIERGYV